MAFAQVITTLLFALALARIDPSTCQTVKGKVSCIDYTHNYDFSVPSWSYPPAFKVKDHTHGRVGATAVVYSVAILEYLTVSNSLLPGIYSLQSGVMKNWIP